MERYFLVSVKYGEPRRIPHAVVREVHLGKQNKIEGYVHDSRMEFDRATLTDLARDAADHLLSIMPDNQDWSAPQPGEPGGPAIGSCYSQHPRTKVACGLPRDHDGDHSWSTDVITGRWDNEA
jgi:hypothetical protein